MIFIFSQYGFSQFSVKIYLGQQPATHPDDSVYLAGNMNGWDPGKSEFMFSDSGQHRFLELKNIAAGNYEFKLTRGDWQKVESTGEGSNIGNRKLKLSSDTVLQLSVAGWLDDFVSSGKHHTASANVHIIDSAFEIPQLNRTRRIWIYLPPGYLVSKKHYPVIYMQDGQNLFDDFTAGYGEWGIDECLDSLISSGKPGCIVVGIDNGEKRMNEYNPYDFENYGPAEGDSYVDFIAMTLKPFIDKHYRTKVTRENTVISGSSLGGLISYYAMLKYPLVFWKGGIFSPAFWTASGIEKATDSLGSSLNGKLFFYMGGAEGKRFLDDMTRIQEKLGKTSNAIIYSVIDPAGKHNELSWRKWFPEFYNWIFADGFNVSSKVGD